MNLEVVEDDCTETKVQAEVAAAQCVVCRIFAAYCIDCINNEVLVTDVPAPLWTDSDERLKEFVYNRERELVTEIYRQVNALALDCLATDL